MLHNDENNDVGFSSKVVNFAYLSHIFRISHSPVRCAELSLVVFFSLQYPSMLMGQSYMLEICNAIEIEKILFHFFWFLWKSKNSFQYSLLSCQISHKNISECILSNLAPPPFREDRGKRLSTRIECGYFITLQIAAGANTNIHD